LAGRKPAAPHVSHEIPEGVEHLFDRERTVAAAEQSEAHQRDWSDGRGTVDAHAELEAELLEREAPLVRVRRGRGVGCAERLPQRERLAEANDDAPVAAAEPAQEA